MIYSESVFLHTESGNNKTNWKTMKIKPTLTKGLRDFLPNDLAKRHYIINCIKNTFEKFGFQAIETPAMEALQTLTGKYGEEGDRLLFKILNSGDYLKNVDSNDLANNDLKSITPKISKKGLRYDLTVPLARFVVQHQNDIHFPFKRYHIAPVWRADRPQKGRYQEFYQCDADVIGSDSLYNEVELLQIYQEVFEYLKLPVEIKYSNRKVLIGFMEEIGLGDSAVQAITILDKLDKIGMDKVLEELKSIGLSEENAILFQSVVEQNDLGIIAHNEKVNEGMKAIDFIQTFAIPNTKFDITLARGLDYYTGCVVEVVPTTFDMGSLGGGGRYDNLTELFGKEDLTGVGISFGLDRIYDTMEGLELFPETLNVGTQVLFTYFSEENQQYAFNAVQTLRQKGIRAEMYPDVVKLGKQMKYADNKNIPYVVVCGDNEMANEQYALKNMKTGEQQLLSLDALQALFLNA